VQAFTKVFESSKAHSAIKLSCLSAMAEILLSVRSSLILILFSSCSQRTAILLAMNVITLQMYDENNVF
jgi:hypothetical protein